MQILFVQHGSGSSNANTVNINQVFIQWQLYPLKTFVDKIFFCVHQKECLVRLWDPYLRFPRIFRICARIRKRSSHTIFVGKIMIISRDFKTPKHFFKKGFHNWSNFVSTWVRWEDFNYRFSLPLPCLVYEL